MCDIEAQLPQPVTQVASMAVRHPVAEFSEPFDSSLDSGVIPVGQSVQPSLHRWMSYSSGFARATSQVFAGQEP